MSIPKQFQPSQAPSPRRRRTAGTPALALAVCLLVVGVGSGSAVVPVPPGTPLTPRSPVVAPVLGNGQSPSVTSSNAGTGSGNPYRALKAPKSDGRLHLVLASPRGQLRLVTKSTELRWVFDRPIIPLATIDQRTKTLPNASQSTGAALAYVDPSKYVRIEPAIEGSFRWSSTRVLVFTPAKKLPASTHFDVTLAGVTALDGTTLAAPVDSSFDTPRVNCTQYGTDRAWSSGRANGAVLVTCDQEVDGADLATHATFAVQRVVDDLANFRPSDADFAAMRLADPKGAALLEGRLSELASGTVDERTAVLTKSGPCPDRGKRAITCHWLSLGSPVGAGGAANATTAGSPAALGNSADLPLDADVQLRFADGIATMRAKLTSLFIQPISLRTPTALLAAVDCTKECDPEGGLNLSLRSEVMPKSLDGKITLTGVDSAGRLGTATTYRYKSDEDSPLSLNWAEIAPGGTYRLELDPTITDSNGRTLGYRYLATVSFGHRSAYVQLPSGEFLSANSQRPLTIPIRNVTAIDQVIRALTIDTLQLTLLAQQAKDSSTLLGLERDSKELLLPQAAPALDRAFDFPIVFPGGPNSTGTFLVAIRGKRFAPLSTYGSTLDWQVAIVQRGDRGITLKRSPIDVLVAVTSLNTRKPGIATGSAAGDQVRVAALPFVDTPQDPSVPAVLPVPLPATSLQVDATDASGFVKLPAPSCPAAAPDAQVGGTNGASSGETKRAVVSVPSEACELVAMVTAADGSALAYNRSSWAVDGDGPRPFEDGVRAMAPVGDPSVNGSSSNQAAPSGAGVALPGVPSLPIGERFVGALFTDRGVYKAGEEVHVRGTLRVEFPRGVKLLPKDLLPNVGVVVTDDTGSEVWRAVVDVDQALARGGFDAVFTLPSDAHQGNYVIAVLNGQVATSFLSTTYRRPEFKVDVSIDRAAYVPGETITGSSSGTYLFGAPMAGLETRWVATASPTSFDPTVGHPDLKLRNFSWTYVCIWYERCDDRNEQGAIGNADAKLDGQGKQAVKVSLPTNNKRHSPLDVTVEGVVSNVDRQVIANRASTLVHVGDYSLGIKSSTYFGNVAKPIEAQVVALKADGTWQSGVLVKTSLLRWDWPEEPDKQGSYAPKATVISNGTLSTLSQASDFAFTPDKPGTYELRVESTDARGNHIEAGVTTYVLGKGASFGGRNSNNIELTASAETFAIGEQAQVLVKSPWPVAEGIVTVERDDIMSYARISVTGGAAALTIPISAESLPNVHVSVMLFRVSPAVSETPDSAAQEPLPQVLTSSLLLRVPPVSRTLGVKVSTDVSTYRPGSEAATTIQLTDLKGGPLDGTVTLWTVDEGVLRLTGYTVPDLLAQLWPQRPNRVQTSDSLTRSLFTEREQTSNSKMMRMKASDGAANALFSESAAPVAAAPAPGRFEADKPSPKERGESQAITLRTDFRVLADWKGDVAVNATGSTTLPMKLPQSLTSYRVIAVASSGNDRFGGSSAVLEIRQPFMVQPALPRFVAIGDSFEAGAVLQNQTGKPGKVDFTVELPTDSPVSIDGPATQTLTLPVGPTEVRFRLRANRLGTWNAQFKAALTGGGTGRDESDAVQISVPVLLTHRLETVAAAGQVIASSSGSQEVEQIVPPLGVVPDQGGLEINTASSALVGLQNGVDYLVEYPYGCLEQRSSRLRALVMLNDLRDHFPLPSLAGEKFKQSITAEVSRIRNYLTPEGGLGYWEGNNSSDVYLSARVLILLLDARDLGVDVPSDVIIRVTGYLNSIVENVKSQSLRRPLQDVDGVWPNRAHVLYALARAGAPDPDLMAKLWTRRAELPVLEQLHLVNAMVLGGMKGIRVNKLYGELLSSVRVEADQAFLQDETARAAWDRFVCPCSAYLNAGNTHNTAEFLSLLVKADPENPLAPQMARWLMAQRDKQGRWDNTLENGYALTALVNYYRAAEPTAPNFKAEVLIGTASAFEKVFSGRSLAAQTAKVPMNKLASTLNAQAGSTSAGLVPLTVKATGTGTLFWNARLRYEPATKTLKALDAGFAVERTYLPYSGSGSKTVNGVSTFAAGDLVRVSLKVRTEQNRRNVVIDDPIPAGLEPLDARLSSTSQNEVSDGAAVADGSSFGIDHVEIQDNRVLLFATGLEPGTFTYTYVARATAPGTFIAAPTQAEEMYRPEIFGRTATATMVITAPKP